jgi:hypothetical protein
MDHAPYHLSLPASLPRLFEGRAADVRLKRQNIGSSRGLNSLSAVGISTLEDEMNKWKLIVLSIFAVAVVAVLPGLTQAYAGVSCNAAVPKPTPDKPVFTAYKGVEIGMAAVDVRKKLGTPKDAADRHEDFVFSDSESAQVYYDTDNKVMAITITYIGKLEAAPSAKAVFGEDVPAKPDGGIFKMERYQKAGYWISYTKTGGDDPLIMIAIQKM